VNLTPQAKEILLGGVRFDKQSVMPKLTEAKKPTEICYNTPEVDEKAPIKYDLYEYRKKNL